MYGRGIMTCCTFGWRFGNRVDNRGGKVADVGRGVCEGLFGRAKMDGRALVCYKMIR